MTRSKAFTMIELSIVVLIIGVLVAGTLKVRTMIDRANQTVAQRLTKNSPLVSMEGLKVWYETTLEESFLDDEIYEGSEISTWNDIKPKSNGPAINATKGGTGPIYTKNAFGSGIPGLKFSGGYMPFDGSFLIGSNYTIIAVEQKTTNSGYNYILGGDINPPAFRFGYRWGTSMLYTHNNADRTIPGQLFFQGNPYIHVLTFENGVGTTYAANHNLISASSAHDTHVTPLTVTDNIAIGRSPNPYIGHFGELIIFNRKLTNNEIKEIEDYLAAKYSIELQE